MKDRVKVGIIGSQFISAIHAESLARCQSAEMLAVASPTAGHAESFAETHHIPHYFTDYHELLAMSEIDMVVIGIPNHVHCEAVVAAAEAVVGLSIILSIFRTRKTLNIDEFNFLKW